MKLFGDFEAVKFLQENLIFITQNGYLYYIYNPKYNHWRKHDNAGNDHLTVSNYLDVRRSELISAMNGIFPKKETDFMRLCNPRELCIRDMLALLGEDFARYMSDYDIKHAVHRVLLESDICHKSFEELKALLGNAVAKCCDNGQVLAEIKELSLRIIGRDIFKREIGIVDGHDGSSYFWIMPVRIIDFTNTLLYAKNLNQEEIDEYNANRPTEDDTDTALILDFYRRFIYRMEYMLKVGKEKGYNLISFMGP